MATAEQAADVRLDTHGIEPVPCGRPRLDTAEAILDLGRREHRADQLGPRRARDHPRAEPRRDAPRARHRQRRRLRVLRPVLRHGPPHRREPDGALARGVRPARRVPACGGAAADDDGLARRQHVGRARPRARDLQAHGLQPPGHRHEVRSRHRDHGDPGRDRDRRVLPDPVLREVHGAGRRGGHGPDVDPWPGTRSTSSGAIRPCTAAPSGRRSRS